MSVQVTLNCQVKPDQFERMMPFLEENLPNVRSFEGNLEVNVLYDKANNEILLDEEWTSVESHQAYLGFIDANGVLASLAAFLRQPPEIKYFKRVEI